MPSPLAVLLAAATGWAWPVAGEVLRAFAVGPDRFAAGQHRGVDLAAPLGAPVRAACGGRVAFAGRVADAGLVVTVACGPHLASHGHLAGLRVRRGQVVAPGAPLGAAGRSGRPSGPRPHVHLSARVAATGAYVDPLGLLPRRGARPPLAPLAPRAPAGRPSRPLRGPVPGRARPPSALPRPAAHPVRAPAAVPRPAPVRPGVPVLAWAGLAAVLAAVPVGALAAHARRPRRAPGAPAPLGSLSRGWPSTSRRRSST